MLFHSETITPSPAPTSVLSRLFSAQIQPIMSYKPQWRNLTVSQPKTILKGVPAPASATNPADVTLTSTVKSEWCSFVSNTVWFHAHYRGGVGTRKQSWTGSWGPKDFAVYNPRVLWCTPVSHERHTVLQAAVALQFGLCTCKTRSGVSERRRFRRYQSHANSTYSWTFAARQAWGTLLTRQASWPRWASWPFHARQPPTPLRPAGTRVSRIANLTKKERNFSGLLYWW